MSEAIIESWARICLKYRKTVLLVVAAVTIVLGNALTHVEFENSIDIWFLEDDPGLRDHQTLLDTFVSDEFIVIGIEAPDVFSTDVVELVDRLSTKIETAPHVEKVFSLTTIESISGDGELLDIGDLVPMPVDTAELGKIREKALANNLYVGNIISQSGDFTCIVVRLPHYRDDFDYKVEAIAAIREILDVEKDTHFYLSGGPVLDEQFYFLSESSTLTTSALMIVALIIILWLLLRSGAGIALPIVTVVLATVWTLGFMGFLQVKATVVTTMLPGLLLAVGVADSMHVLVTYRNHIRAGLEKMIALRETFHELLPPLFLTSITTAIGMSSLAVSKISSMREFGLFAAFGVGCAFILSITLVPVLLSYLPAPRVRATGVLSATRSEAMLAKLHAFTMRRAPFIAGGFVILIVACLASASRVKAESVFLEYFKEGEQIRVDTERIEDALAGTVSLDVIVDTGKPDGIKDPAVLANISELQTFLEQQRIVTSSQSVTDYFKDLRRAFFDNDQSQYRLPDSKEEAAQYLLLYEMDAPDGDIKEFVTFDYAKARVTSRVELSSSNEAIALVRATQQHIRENFPRDLDGLVTGVTVLYGNMEEYIRDSLVRGFSLALVAIFALLCLQMRSIPLGMFAMLPNVIPIVVCLGFMGATGIHLDTMTAMVASIAIGLAVDDTIHFVTRVRYNLSKGMSMRQALEETTVQIGRALCYTSLTLTVGFGVQMTSSFVGAIYFGMLSVITIVFALAADLLLLPVVLNWYAGGDDGEAVAVDFPPHAAPAEPARG